MQLKREKRIWIAVGCATLGLALVVLFLFDPARSGFYPQCWLHKLTGLSCPGCGSLRAVHHLLHGQLVVAFRCNPLLVVLIPIAAGFLLRRLFKLWRGELTPVKERNRNGCYWVILVVLVVFGVLRNLPFAAFAWMSP